MVISDTPALKLNLVNFITSAGMGGSKVERAPPTESMIVKKLV